MNKHLVKIIVSGLIATNMIIPSTITAFAAETEASTHVKTFEEIVGRPMTAEELEGDPADKADVSTVKENTGSVTIKADIDWNIHEPAFVTLTEVNTGAEYTFDIFEVNAWETTGNIPEGIYVTGGGLNADVKSRFRMSESYYNISPYTNTVVEVKLIDHQKELEAAEEKRKITDSVVEKVDISTEDDNKNAEKTGDGSFIGSLIKGSKNTYSISTQDTISGTAKILFEGLIVAAAVIGYKVFKKKKRKEDEEDLD